MIYIVSSKKAAALGLDNKAVWARVLPELPRGFAIEAGDQVYLDISGLSATEIKKLVTRHKKCFPGSFWGIIDPKGAAEDPALFFFEGAGDYIGPALVKKGLVKKRFTVAYARAFKAGGADAGDSAAGEEGPGGLAGRETKSRKLPAGKFDGWQSVKPGVSAPFFFVFVSVAEQSKVHTMTGAANSVPVKNRLREALQQYFREADALLWMEAEDNFLFLVPPRASNGKLIIEAALKVLINSRIIGLEKLGLSFPLEFTIAMHYGATTFHAPGKTGAVISESVNYIFHLGTRKAEAGRLTVSAAVFAEAFPRGIEDIFRPAGEFEGILVKHSRRFL